VMEDVLTEDGDKTLGGIGKSDGVYARGGGDILERLV
jgi:hypothetical protein